MRRKTFFTIFLFFLVSQIYVANGQFNQAEIAQRQELEEFLKSAEIIEHGDIGEGVTKPKKIQSNFIKEVENVKGLPNMGNILKQAQQLQSKMQSLGVRQKPSLGALPIHPL